MVALSDLPGTHADVTYVFRAFSSGKLTKPVRQDSSPGLLTVSLPIQGWDIYSAYPISTFDFGPGTINVANLGLLGKMTGAAAIVSSDFGRLENGRVSLDTRLKALGKLGMTWYASLLTVLADPCH